MVVSRILQGPTSKAQDPGPWGDHTFSKVYYIMVSMLMVCEQVLG